MNVQAICNADMSLLNAVVRWPGSTHDSFICENCALKQRFADGDFGDAILLADSGYPLRPYLMVPMANLQSEAELRFNQAHSKTRVKVECAFGLLKSRFRSLDKSAGALQLAPERMINIIRACMILHNMAISRRIPLPGILRYHLS